MGHLTDKFVCDKCGNLDSIYSTHQTTAGGFYCARCQAGSDGSWHGYFDEVKEQDDPDHGPLINRRDDSDDDANWPSFS